MKIKRYIRRIRSIAQGIAKQTKLRKHSHVIMIGTKEYDEIFVKAGGDLENPKEFITIAKLVMVKNPYIAKRKYQVLPWKEYLHMWNKHEERAKLMRKANEKKAKVTPPQKVA